MLEKVYKSIREVYEIEDKRIMRGYDRDRIGESVEDRVGYV